MSKNTTDKNKARRVISSVLGKSALILQTVVR